MIRRKSSNSSKNTSTAEKAADEKLPPSSKKRRKLKCILIPVLILAGIGIIFFAAANITANAYSDYVFDDLTTLPECRSAIVLGCSPHHENRVNLYFRNRMDAAAKLYHSGKVKKLIVSGDNGRKNYNEPEAMRQALIARGVPDEDIYCDYAGFSTLDSMIRAKSIFEQEKFIVISQRFHCERAVFISRCKGLESYGYAAIDINSRRWKYRNHLRESLARPAALLDLIFCRDARFAGEKVSLDFPQEKAAE